MIYTTNLYEIHRLTFAEGYELVAEIFKEDRLIAALFREIR